MIMCDYSLQSVKTKKAEINDKLVTTNFNTGTIGFACEHDASTAVCVLPGTEIAFEEPIKRSSQLYHPREFSDAGHKVGIFRQVNKEDRLRHHDALELPGGEVILLTMLETGQRAKVLQMPAIIEERLPYYEAAHDPYISQIAHAVNMHGVVFDAAPPADAVEPSFTVEASEPIVG